jgi:hypothetical protein
MSIPNPYISLPPSLETWSYFIYPEISPVLAFGQDFDPNDYLVLFPLEVESTPNNAEIIREAELRQFLFAETCFVIKRKLDDSDFRNFDILAERLGSTFNKLELFYAKIKILKYELNWESNNYWIQLTYHRGLHPFSLADYLTPNEFTNVVATKLAINEALRELGDPNDTLDNGIFVRSIKTKMISLWLVDERRRPKQEP